MKPLVGIGRNPAVPVHSVISAADVLEARRQLVARVARLDPSGEANLMLSGGVDSATILFALLEAGRTPHCLTFQVGDRTSNDVRVASSMCQRFGLRHTIVRIAPDLLRDDVAQVLCMVDWTKVERVKKTIVQCVHPFLYLCRAMTSDMAFTGIQGDSFFLTDRKSNVARHAHGEEYVWGWRRSYAADPVYSDYHIGDVAQRVYGKTLVDVYDWPWWAWWIQHYSTALTNTPKTKWAAVRIFEDYWRKGAWFREPDRFQIGSGLRELHDTLLRGTRHRAVIAVYNEMARGLGVDIGTNIPPYTDRGLILAPDGSAYGEPDADPLKECVRAAS